MQKAHEPSSWTIESCGRLTTLLVLTICHHSKQVILISCKRRRTQIQQAHRKTMKTTPKVHRLSGTSEKLSGEKKRCAENRKSIFQQKNKQFENKPDEFLNGIAEILSLKCETWIVASAREFVYEWSAQSVWQRVENVVYLLLFYIALGEKKKLDATPFRANRGEKRVCTLVHHSWKIDMCSFGASWRFFSPFIRSSISIWSDATQKTARSFREISMRGAPNKCANTIEREKYEKENKQSKWWKKIFNNCLTFKLNKWMRRDAKLKSTCASRCITDIHHWSL